MESEATQPRKSPTGLWKRIAWALLILILLFALTLIGINVYLSSQSQKVYNQIEALNDGSLSFRSCSISLFRDFPEATLHLQNIKLSDSAFAEGRPNLLEAGELNAALSLLEWRKGNIEISALQLKEGFVHIHTDAHDLNNLGHLLNRKEKEESRLTIILNENLHLALIDMELHITDVIVQTNVHGIIQLLEAHIDIEDGLRTAQVEMQLDMERMQFKDRNGAFLKGSRLESEMDLTIGNGAIRATSPQLMVDGLPFGFFANIVTDGSGNSELSLTLKDGEIDVIKPLLADNIREALTKYDIRGKFDSKTTLIGTFLPGNNPIVEVAFTTQDNDLRVKDLVFPNSRLKGRLYNRIYTDERSENEGRMNFRFEIDSLQSHYEGFTIHSAKGLVITGPETGDRLDIRAKISGPMEGISTILKNDHFFFEEGDIWIMADIKGDVTNASEIIRLSDADARMTSPVVYYKPADARFSLDGIELIKKGPNADVVISGKALNQEHSFLISGGIDNLDAVIEGYEDGRVSSTVKVSSERLSWKDVVDLFGQESSPTEGPIRDERLKKKSMKQTLEGIQSHFNPNVSVAIDTFMYGQGVEMVNFRTGLFFINTHELNLKKTQFTLDGAPVEFNGSIDIEDELKTSFSYSLDAQHLNLETLLPKVDYFRLDLLKDIDEQPRDVDLYLEQIGLIDDVQGLIPNSSTGIIRFRSNGSKAFNGQVEFRPDDPNDPNHPSTKVRLEGEPDLFNDFFQNEEFFFEGGKFEAFLNYGGTAKNVESLINRADIQLELKDSEIFYKSVGVRFPVRHISMDMIQDTADFSILLSEGSIGQSLSVKGHAEALSEIIFGPGEKDFQTHAKIHSPHIIWPHVHELINSVGELRPDTGFTSPKLKETVRGIMRTFEPDLEVIIDTLEYSEEFILHNVYSGVSVDEKDLLTLDRTGFDFNAGTVGLKGNIDLSGDEETPFTVDLNTEQLDIGELLKDLDYFSISSLKSTEELQGELTMDLSFSGAINANGSHLVMEKNKGLLSFQLVGLEIQGMPMIDTLAQKIKLSKRMDHLLFAPLTNTLIMDGDIIHVPLMEVQSNALNLFLEGELSTGDRTNLWVTVPLDNLGKRDLSEIPKKRGYENSGEKIHLELLNTKTGVFKSKLHTSRRKFYKQRGIKPRFKEDKRFFRNLRRDNPKD